MSNCGGSDPCAPVNPCDCAETAAIREQGPQGARGLPGSIPVFQIGTVVAGLTPRVTITEVNPLLYTLDFVIPSANLNSANLWTGIQTFQQQAVFLAGINSSGTSNIDGLTATTAFVSSGTSLFVGVSTFSGAAAFNGGIAVAGGIVTDNLEVDGNATFPGATPITMGECIKGQVYLDSCNKLRYLTGNAPNIATNNGSFSSTITPGSSETAMPINVPFTIPSSCTCGTALARDATITGLLEFVPAATVTSGAVDVSIYIMRIRLDNATTGAIVYSSRVSNLDAARNFFVQANAIPPGAHTAFVTLTGAGIGTQNLTAIALGFSVEF